MKAEQVKEKILKAKGQFLRARWVSEPTPKAEFKEKRLKKVTTAVIRAGIQYQNLASVKESGKETGPLPWGSWKEGNEGYIIEHKGAEYIRLYPSPAANHIPSCLYFCDGRPVTKEQFLSFLPPSAAKKQEEQSVCFNIKEENLLDINEDS